MLRFKSIYTSFKMSYFDFERTEECIGFTVLCFFSSFYECDYVFGNKSRPKVTISLSLDQKWLFKTSIVFLYFEKPPKIWVKTANLILQKLDSLVKLILVLYSMDIKICVAYFVQKKTKKITFLWFRIQNVIRFCWKNIVYLCGCNRCRLNSNIRRLYKINSITIIDIFLNFRYKYYTIFLSLRIWVRFYQIVMS